MSAVISSVALAVTAYSSYRSARAQEKAADQQEEARKKDQQLREIEAAKSRTQAVREARARRAQVANTGSQIGVQGSSGLGGANATIGSQLGSNLASSYTRSGYASSIGDNMAKSSEYMQDASSWNTIGSVSSSIGEISTTLGKAGKHPLQ